MWKLLGSCRCGLTRDVSAGWVFAVPATGHQRACMLGVGALCCCVVCMIVHKYGRGSCLAGGSRRTSTEITEHCVSPVSALCVGCSFRSLFGTLEELLQRPEVSIRERLQVGRGAGAQRGQQGRHRGSLPVGRLQPAYLYSSCRGVDGLTGAGRRWQRVSQVVCCVGGRKGLAGDEGGG